MAEPKRHDWFVWPKNSHTNEVFARFLESGDYGFEADILRDASCEDGKKRSLWRCSYDGAWYLWRSRADLRFEIFNQKSRTGKIRNVTFLFKNEHRSPKKKKKRKEAVR